MKAYAGQMFTREIGDKVWFVGVIDKPDELETFEVRRPIVLIPGKGQTAMMLIDPGEEIKDYIGYGANGIVSNGDWRSNILEFDDLPINIRALAYPFVTGMREILEG